MKINSAFRGR